MIKVLGVALPTCWQPHLQLLEVQSHVQALLCQMRSHGHEKQKVDDRALLHDLARVAWM